MHKVIDGCGTELQFTTSVTLSTLCGFEWTLDSYATVVKSNPGDSLKPTRHKVEPREAQRWTFTIAARQKLQQHMM